MGTYLNENNVKLFSCKILSTCLKLLNEFDELKKNNGSEEKILHIKEELAILNKLLESVNKYSEYCGYTKS
jgi:hypothetical protein